VDGPDEVRQLREELRRLQLVLRADMQARWKRDLPFEELLFDRWERAEALGFGPRANIYQLSYVYGDVQVGDHTWIGPFTILDGSGGIQIGKYCSISAGVHIYTHDSVRWALTAGRSEHERAPVRIGDCCYIGPHTVIAKGVTIGHHAVVGASSFVNRDVEANSIVAGAPCRRIGRVVVDGASVQLQYSE
jgi:acetyltransferase-like isoleucine patch superfamily enzyme